MRFFILTASLVGAVLSLVTPALSETMKVDIGLAGWTGFAPLTLADKAGIFKKNGLDVTLHNIPQSSRNLALASNQIQCAATTIDAWIVWNSAGIATRQIFQMDKSYGADGMVVRPNIKSIADLKGKTVAASSPGTSSYFTLAWFLKKNGLSIKDVTIVNLDAGPAAQAFLAGRNDAAMTYEPYLSSVRAKPAIGKIIATTLDYPMVMDTFACTTKFLADNPKAAKALVESYFQAVDMIAKEPDKSNGIMGAASKQTAKEFAESASYLRWPNRAENKKFFSGEFQTFNKEAADLLLEDGIIKKKPDLDKLIDPSFLN